MAIPRGRKPAYMEPHQAENASLDKGFCFFLKEGGDGSLDHGHENSIEKHENKIGKECIGCAHARSRKSQKKEKGPQGPGGAFSAVSAPDAYQQAACYHSEKTGKFCG